MIYEIVNPSDAVTIKASDPLVAAVCTLLLAQGQYGLSDEHDNTILPVMIFGGIDEWLLEHKINDLDKFIDTHISEMIETLESVVYGSIDSRKLFDSAISKMSPYDASKYRIEWNDSNRTSLTNIGYVYQAYANKLRKLLPISPDNIIDRIAELPDEEGK